MWKIKYNQGDYDVYYNGTWMGKFRYKYLARTFIKEEKKKSRE